MTYTPYYYSTEHPTQCGHHIVLVGELQHKTITQVGIICLCFKTSLHLEDRKLQGGREEEEQICPGHIFGSLQMWFLNPLFLGDQLIKST